MPTSHERWKVFRRFCYDGILSNRLRLYRNVVHRSVIAAKVRPPCHKERSLVQYFDHLSLLSYLLVSSLDGCVSKCSENYGFLFIQLSLSLCQHCFLYTLLYRAMERKMTAGKSLESQTGKRTSSKHIRVQRNFVRVNFMPLAVLIMCNMPSAVP